MTYAADLLAVNFNRVIGKALLRIEGSILVLIAVLIPLLHLALHSRPSEVFTVFIHGDDWDSRGLSLFIGLVGDASIFRGRSSPSAPLVTGKQNLILKRYRWSHACGTPLPPLLLRLVDVLRPIEWL